jgi:hypothetical protein
VPRDKARRRTTVQFRPQVEACEERAAASSQLDFILGLFSFGLDGLSPAGHEDHAQSPPPY